MEADGVPSQQLCPEAPVAAGSAVAALAAVGGQHLAEEALEADASPQLDIAELSCLAARLAEFLAWFEVANNDESTAGREAFAAEVDDRMRAASEM
mmetsp:Transcript_21813/g.70600  ORF Transcript_21813/g.70600 Transcript_21813/m.70600 type:complete len:96 (+) Transcript_21813:773-1060(+)